MRADASAASDGIAATDAFTAPARCELPPITAPQQYQMQFTTTEEHVRLVERAKALLARSSPGVSLGELHRKAMQLLVEQLEKQRFATQARRPSPKAERSGTSEARAIDRRSAAPAR